MFLSYYGLREQPFGVTPDPRFLYFGQVHREALASLVYGVEAGLGFTSLIAEPGTGKTTLLYYILGHYRATARTAFIFDTQCTSRELLRNLLVEFEIDDPAERDPAAWLNRLKEFLAVQARARRRVLVVLDEAQNFDGSVLETIRLLSNFETAGSKLLHIMLSGQPQLAEKLSQPALMNVRQRITIATRLRPFAPLDAVKYVAHRLSVAGYQGQPLFTAAALESITRLSGGIPREINRLCFGAMSMGCALDRKMIDADIVREVANDFDFSSLLSAKPAPKMVEQPPSEQLERAFAESLAMAQKAGAASQAPREQASPVPAPSSPTRPAGAAPAAAATPKPATPAPPKIEARAEQRRPVVSQPAAIPDVKRAIATAAAPPAAPKREPAPVGTATHKKAAGGAASAAKPRSSAVIGIVPSVAWTPTTRRPSTEVPLQSFIAQEQSRRGPQRPALIAAVVALLAIAAIAIQLLPEPAAAHAPAPQVVQPAEQAQPPAIKPATPHSHNRKPSASGHEFSHAGSTARTPFQPQRTTEALNRHQP